MKQVFIDTNIFLSFYDYSDDDIKTLSDIVDHLENKNIKLYITSQIRDEVRRNREKKIKQCIDEYQKTNLSPKIPRIFQGIDGADEIRDLQSKIVDLRKKVVEEVLQKAKEQSLQADLLIESIFAKAGVKQVADHHLDRAKRRIDLGNPPGKDRSLGDAINWEVILSEIEFLDDLYLVSADKDYANPLDPSSINGFLKREFESHTFDGEIKFYKSLGSLIKELIPEKKEFAERIERIPQDENRKSLVIKLCSSGSFAQTHSAVHNLKEYEFFQEEEISDLVKAAKANNQIEWILGDADVFHFYKGLYENNFGHIRRELADELAEIIRQNQPEEDEDS